MRRPRAAAFRAACAGGWRGPSHPVDWDEAGEDRLDELMRELGNRLTAPADRAPVAALKSLAELERLAQRIGQEAAYAAQADELSPETIGRWMLPRGFRRIHPETRWSKVVQERLCGCATAPIIGQISPTARVHRSAR
jgi:hypothetical protein